MRWIGAEELRAACDLAALIEALEAGHRRPKPETADALVGPADKQYLIRSSHDGMALIGSKLITIHPDNPVRGDLPSVQAVIVLFDSETGTPRAALDATELTYWKTAADSALGARLLARSDAETLLMVGAGGLAPWLVRGHLCVRPSIRKVQVWNRTQSRAEAVVAGLVGEGIAAETAGDLEQAVRAADIVSTATMARDPILRGAWLTPGAHVDLVGSYSRDTREADDAVLQRGRLFVDSRTSALDGGGDIVTPLSSGVITEADILGNLFELVSGACVGREGAADITVFKNAGGAHLDLMIASALLDRVGQREG